MRTAVGMSVVGVIAILALLIAGTALSVVLVNRAEKQPVEESRKEHTALMLTMTGLDRPVANKLDPHFADVDQDLIADAPADPKLLVDPAVLKFSYVVEEGEDFKEIFSDLLSAISKATGKPVEYQAFESTAEELKALRDGELHIAGLGTGKVPIAVNAAGFVPEAVLADPQGSTHYQMEIIAAAASPIQSLSDLRGRTLLCTDAGSNSGFKAALLAMKEKDLLPERDYQIIYSNGHEESIRQIAAKEQQAAAIANDVLKTALASGQIKESDFRSLYKSENFPTAGFGVSYRLKPELREKVKQALLAFSIPGTSLEKKFGPQQKTRFVPVNFKNDWALIRQIDNLTGSVHELPK